MKTDVMSNDFEKIHSDTNGVNTYAITTHASDLYHNYLIAHETQTQLDIVINFQNGPVKEVDVNGITNEALLSILIHRTQGLNSKFPCQENSDALYGMKKALQAFESRTKNRIARGVEGQNKL